MKINLASFRIAFFLIAILIILIILSAIIPQKDIAVGQIVDFKEKLGDAYIIIEILKLDEIYTSPYFFILLGLLAINLISANLKRFKIIYKTEKTLVKARHIGSIIFHFSLILILLGVILNYLYRFEGVFALTEGQQVNGSENSYFRIYKGPLSSHRDDNFVIKLESIDVMGDYSQIQKATQINLSIQQNRSEQAFNQTIATNHPYLFDDLTIHYGMLTGYSPYIDFFDTSGTQLIQGFIRVAVQNTDEGLIHSDFVFVDEEKMRISLEMIPDEKSILQTSANVIVEDHDQIYFNGEIAIGEKVSFDRYELILPSIRHWCYIKVTTTPFLNLIFVGFWLGLSGMVIGFIPRIIKEKGKS
jgi:hypothetical protein